MNGQWLIANCQLSMNNQYTNTPIHQYTNLSVSQSPLPPMPNPTPQMTAADVIAFVQLLREHHFEVIIDGGWAVDALLGRQTRVHSDLDIALNHQDVPLIRALLEEHGYKDVPRDDSWECNFVLGDDQGHLIDFHSCTFDADGNNIFGVPYPYASLQGNGSINGFPVRCVPADWLVQFHTGYKLDEGDYQDVKALCQQFGLEIPADYATFVQNDVSNTEMTP